MGLVSMVFWSLFSNSLYNYIIKKIIIVIIGWRCCVRNCLRASHARCGETRFFLQLLWSQNGQKKWKLASPAEYPMMHCDVPAYRGIFVWFITVSCVRYTCNSDNTVVWGKGQCHYLLNNYLNSFAEEESPSSWCAFTIAPTCVFLMFCDGRYG